jgi:uncharacterized membrane protein YbhN (UPF0104 family)
VSGYAEGVDNRIRPKLIQLGTFAAKFAVTSVCFWYLASNVAVGDLLRAARTLDLLWTGLAILSLMIEVPIVGLRWCSIANALGDGQHPIKRGPMVAIIVIANFFAQVVPNIAADTLRVWMLTTLDRGWRQAIASVIIDRAVGIAALLAIGFVVLLFPSALTALGGHRIIVTEIFGALLVIGGAALFLAHGLGTLLQVFRYTAALGRLAKAANTVLLGRQAGFSIMALAVAVHLFTILAVWLLARAAGLPLTILEAAVLFVVIVAVALIPISIAGWGVRELAVTSLLASHGVPVEQGLFFSVCFGLALLVAALPGALVWAAYSPSRRRNDLAKSHR